MDEIETRKQVMIEDSIVPFDKQKFGVFSTLAIFYCLSRG